MAKSEEIKLEELKRLLRRLDKTLPPAPPVSQEPPDLAMPPPLAAHEAHLPAIQPLAVSPLQPVAGRQAGLPRHAPAGFAAIRTVLLAAGVSAGVSGSIAFVVFNNTAPRPPKVLETPSLPAEPASKTNPLLAAGSIPPEAVPVPAEAKRVAAIAATEPVTPPVEAVAPTPAPAEAPAVETGSAKAEVPPEPEPVPQQSAPEPALSDKADSEALAALDASQFLRRGLNMLVSGNIGAAQLLLERAAELGNGDAAFALATTYDGAPGAPRSGATVRPNAGLALRWYERARELGISDAGKRIGELRKDASSGG